MMLSYFRAVLRTQLCFTKHPFLLLSRMIDVHSRHYSVTTFIYTLHLDDDITRATRYNVWPIAYNVTATMTTRRFR